MMYGTTKNKNRSKILESAGWASSNFIWMLIPSIFISLEFTVQEFILALKILNFVQRRYIFM